jgi:hypothetical protein
MGTIPGHPDAGIAARAVEERRLFCAIAAAATPAPQRIISGLTLKIAAARAIEPTRASDPFLTAMGASRQSACRIMATMTGLIPYMIARN